MNMLFLRSVYEYTYFTLKAHAKCKTDDYFESTFLLIIGSLQHEINLMRL